MLSSPFIMPKGNPKGASSKATSAAPVMVRIEGGPDTWLNHLPDEHSKSFPKFLRGDCAALENKVRRWHILRGAGYVDSRFILRSRPLDLIIGQGCHNWVDLDPLRGVAWRWYFHVRR